MEALCQVNADGLEVLYNFRHMHDIVTNSTTIASPDRNRKLEPNFDLSNYNDTDRHIGHAYGKPVVSSYNHSITCTIGRNDQDTSNQIELRKRKRARDLGHDIAKGIIRLRTASSAVDDQVLEGGIHGGCDSQCWESQKEEEEEFEEGNTSYVGGRVDAAELDDDVKMLMEDVGRRSTEEKRWNMEVEDEMRMKKKKRERRKGVRVEVRRTCIRVVEFSDPVYVEVGEGGFADMVQNLTGQSSSINSKLQQMLCRNDELHHQPPARLPNDAQGQVVVVVAHPNGQQQGVGSTWSMELPPSSPPLTDLDALFADFLLQPLDSSSFFSLI